MTREEILAMEPGYELDELISNHLFGVVMVAHVPYSTDISAAWEVVEHLRKEHGLRLCLELHYHSGCYIWLKSDMGGNVTGCYEFKNEIEGISKIALLAVMDLPTQD